jgi:molybdopterin synthase catalytic subunit
MPDPKPLSDRPSEATAVPAVDDWIREAKAAPGADRVGMILVHDGVVRGTARSGAPVSGMLLTTDRKRLDEVIAEARGWPGVVVVRAWANEGRLAVGDDIMKVLIAGDIRENVFAGLERLVRLLKTEVLSESELP